MSMVIDGSNGLTYPNSATNGGYINGGTAVASTSGTSIDFTSIPSWVKRITVMFNGVSTNGSSPIHIQIGNGSVVTSGYVSQTWSQNTNSGSATAGMPISATNATASVWYGQFILTNISGNIWAGNGCVGGSGTYMSLASGGITLGGTLDRVRITTVNGTDTFDAGSINILYE